MEKKKRGGKSPRTKGYNFERRVVRIFKENFINARRTPASMWPEIWVDGKYAVSCKVKAKGLTWAYRELLHPDKPYDYILFKADRLPVLKISLWKYDT